MRTKCSASMAKPFSKNRKTKFSIRLEAIAMLLLSLSLCSVRVSDFPIFQRRDVQFCHKRLTTLNRGPNDMEIVVNANDKAATTSDKLMISYSTSRGTRGFSVVAETNDVRTFLSISNYFVWLQRQRQINNK